MRSVAAALMLLCAAPLVAASAARDLILPAAGHTSSATRTFTTSIWITNVSAHTATVTTSFLASGHANPNPPASQFQLARNQTRLLDPLRFDGLGALRLQSNAELIASARVSSNELSTTFAAIPVRFAIGSGQSSTVQGYEPQDMYKLYVVETAGEPLDYSISLLNRAGAVVAEKRLFIDRYEHAVLDLGAMFSHADAAIVRVDGRNGTGRIVFMGLQVPRGTQDGDAFEMSFTAAPRSSISWPEGVAYFAIAIGVLVAAFAPRRHRRYSS